MVSVEPNNNTCSVFETITGASPGRLLRFVVGEDVSPRELTAADISAELADPFTALLLTPPFPRTADEVLAQIDLSTGAADSLGSAGQQSFLLGEGSQLAADAVDPGSRGMRFLVTRGTAPHGPELIISASHPQGGLVEVMAWDSASAGFNFYRNLDGGTTWVFAGNSKHALLPASRRKGPFESHPTGNLLMKELKLPWVHWDSFKVQIPDTVFDTGDVRRTHRWFLQKRGAEDLETSVVMPSIERWTAARFDQAIDSSGSVDSPGLVVEQMLTNATVNLVSSSRESGPLGAGQPIDLPPTFFVDADGLESVGLPVPPPLAVSADIYAASLARFEFRLDSRDGFQEPGDTHFAFVVPERAFEDIETTRQAMARGLISDRLAAALIMVDFPNPVFSLRRTGLLGFAPETATIAGGVSTFSDELAESIVAAAPSTPAGSAENEFAELWGAGDQWRTEFAARLAAYYQQIETRLATQEGFNDYVRLAEARRNRVRQMPIFEFPLLFAETNLDSAAELDMRADGTVNPIA